MQFNYMIVITNSMRTERSSLLCGSCPSSHLGRSHQLNVRVVGVFMNSFVFLTCELIESGNKQTPYTYNEKKTVIELSVDSN